MQAQAEKSVNNGSGGVPSFFFFPVIFLGIGIRGGKKKNKKLEVIMGVRWGANHTVRKEEGWPLQVQVCVVENKVWPTRRGAAQALSGIMQSTPYGNTNQVR